MKFTYEGSTYLIEFERKKHKRKLGGLTTFPDTTVRILVSRPNRLPGELYRTATVGCSIHDKFSLERGRLAALRLVSMTLDKDFKKALWTNYINRFPPKPVKPTLVKGCEQ